MIQNIESTKSAISAIRTDIRTLVRAKNTFVDSFEYTSSYTSSYVLPYQLPYTSSYTSSHTSSYEFIYTSSYGTGFQHVFTSSLEIEREVSKLSYVVSSMIDELNEIGISEPGYPLEGEWIVRVGQQVEVEWNETVVPSVNIFFMKGGTKLPITTFRNDSQGKKSFIIDSTHFSDEYLPCKVRVEYSDVDTIFDESLTFKVLKSN